jgi:regulator of sigma E protease
LDILGSALAQMWSVLGYVGPFLFVLGLVIFVHEYGHYIVGRWCGVGVEAFSIGFGPRVFGWRDAHGTDWKLSAIPLGGYVKFRGDLNGASMPDSAAADEMSPEHRAEAFQFKPVWKRAAIVAAGPIANFILALVIFSATLMMYGRYEIQPVIDRVVEGSPAAKAGILPGDRVLAINGRPVQVFDDIRNAIIESDTDVLKFEIDRKGTISDIIVTAPVAEQRTKFGVHRVRMAGVGSSALPEHRRHVSVGPLEAVAGASDQVVGVISQSMRFIGRLMTGRENPDQLSGPIHIAQISGKVAETGFMSLLSLAAIISISIGFLNLLPVPLLDGGHLMFYAFEAVFGRPLSQRSQEVFFRIGFALVLMLMAFSVVNDLVRLAK